MPPIREHEPAFLISVARAGVEATSIRAVAHEVGMRHGGLSDLLAGETQWVFGATIKRLRAWYWLKWLHNGGVIAPESALYLLEQLLAPLRGEDRTQALVEIVTALERIFDGRDSPRPAWLLALRAEQAGPGAEKAYGSRPG